MARTPTTIFLVRHGETVTNREGRFCGHSETTLTDRGRRQAAALRHRLAAIPIDAVVTSDLGRAIETAAIALEGRDLQPALDPAFRELHYGEWEQEKERDVARRFPEQIRLMRDEHPGWQPPGGETMAMVRGRTAAAFWRVAKAHQHKSTLVVSHGTAIACLVSELLAISPSHTFRFAIANCGLTRVEVASSRALVVTLNDTAHLTGIESSP